MAARASSSRWSRAPTRHEEPFFKGNAEPGASQYHQIFLDQMLGPSVGRVVNDVSTDIAAGNMTPKDAAQADRGRLEIAQPARRTDGLLSSAPRGHPRGSRQARPDRHSTPSAVPAAGAAAVHALRVLPVGEAAWYSFFRWNGFGTPTEWVGLRNYQLLFEHRAFRPRCATTR